MTRVNHPSAIKHRGIKKAAKGFKQSRRRRLKVAKEAVMHAGQYAYAGRMLRRRDFRSLWIVRLNAALRAHNLSYSVFISLLKKSNIALDRKVLSQIAEKYPSEFAQIIKSVK